MVNIEDFICVVCIIGALFILIIISICIYLYCKSNYNKDEEILINPILPIIDKSKSLHN